MLSINITCRDSRIIDEIVRAGRTLMELGCDKVEGSCPYFSFNFKRTDTASVGAGSDITEGASSACEKEASAAMEAEMLGRLAKAAEKFKAKDDANEEVITRDFRMREGDDEIVQAAIARFNKDGSMEIDPDSVCAHGDDNGCYVLAWKWFDFADTKWDKDAQDDDQEGDKDADQES